MGVLNSILVDLLLWKHFYCAELILSGDVQILNVFPQMLARILHLRLVKMVI